jgi:DnaJ-class molecular chaperone
LGALGILPAPKPDDLQQAADTETCPECDGWGDVLTGAKVERGRIKPCSRCTGTGYIVHTNAPTVPLANGPASQPTLEPEWAAEARAAGYTIIAPYTSPSPAIQGTGGL